MNIYDYLHRDVVPEDDLCFVIMPFENELNSVFQYGIKPIVEELRFRCRRADQHFASSPIMFEIFDDILKARIIIADLTGANPNVFYELGICHALKRNVILLKQQGSPVPFDLHGIRHFEYEKGFGAESKLREFLKSALNFEKSEEETALFDKETMKKNLKKAYHLWKSSKEILLRFEDFMEIVLNIDSLPLTENEVAFLCYASAYYGKFMRRMTELAYSNKEAITSLIIEVATGTTTRVPWRAAAMLEHLNNDIVKRVIASYKGTIRNSELFPDAILEGSTISRLVKTMDEPLTSEIIHDKLGEVLKQVKVEFER